MNLTTTETHIQRLAQAGVATHIVADQGAVDSLFALSKVRDFPEVQFAATFPDGTIVLGCPAELPEALYGLATPITVHPVAPADPTPGGSSSLEAKLDQLIAATQHQPAGTEIDAKLTTMATTLSQALARPQQAVGPDLSAELHSIQTALQRLTQSTAPGEGDARLDEMLQGQQQALEVVTQSQQLTADLSQTLKEIDNRMAKMADVTPALLGLGRKVAALSSSAGATADLSIIQDSVGEIRASLNAFTHDISYLRSIAQAPGIGEDPAEYAPKVMIDDAAAAIAQADTDDDAPSAAPMEPQQETPPDQGDEVTGVLAQFERDIAQQPITRPVAANPPVLATRASPPTFASRRSSAGADISPLHRRQPDTRQPETTSANILRAVEELEPADQP